MRVVMNREEAKRQDEFIVMTQFVQWLGEQQGLHYELVARPDPPSN